jgi:hypothetical protein
MILKQSQKTREELKKLKEPFDDLMVRLINIAHEQGISVQVLKARGFSCRICLQNKEGKVYNNARTYEKLWDLAGDLGLVSEGLKRKNECDYLMKGTG